MTTTSLDRAVFSAVAALSLIPAVSSINAGEPQSKPRMAKNAKDGAKMILIPGGRFLMGTTKEETDAQFRETGLPEEWKKYTDDERPRHEKTLKPYFIYKHEVTNAQYKSFLDAANHRAPPHWKGRDIPAGRENHPVVEVSWDDAAAYCLWAGTRLPSEAEWEFAARGPAPAEGKPSRAFPWGDKWDRKFSNNASLHAKQEIVSAESWKEWYEGEQQSRYPLTMPVGSFPKSASPFGAHDMAGNAWEWCAEVQAPYPDQKPEAAEKLTFRARRGGSWANVAMHIRSADRQPAARDDLNIYTGFRCVKSP